MTRSPPALPRLRLLMAAVLFGAAALPALGQSGSDDPKPTLILREGCCFIPPTSPLADQTNPAPQPLPQADAPLPPQPSEAPIQMPPPPAGATGAVSVAPSAATPLNTEIDSGMEEERGSFIDTLKGVLDGRPARRPPAITDSVAVPSPTHPGQAANAGQRAGGLTASRPWRVLEVLSLVFALGIAAAAAYFYTRRSSEMAD